MTDKPHFVYVIYIRATPEKLWNALTDPEVTKLYWGQRNVSDWQAGSSWEHQRADDPTVVLLRGTVIESMTPRRLVLTWAPPADTQDKAKHSRVTFEIDPFGPDGDTSRLKVTHSDLEPGSEMQASVTEGWPMVISGLKTYLETGWHYFPA